MKHPCSINDAGFFNPNVSSWVDQPASYHNGAAGFSFADGHSEIHKWSEALLNTPAAKKGGHQPSTVLRRRWFHEETRTLVG